jgi:1,4-dihydroxy-2-naphthoate octaprenyltransferase
MESSKISDRRTHAEKHAPSWLNKWWVAMRPFALPASTMPVIFGTVLAVTIGGAPLKTDLFFAALFGMAILHTGANLLNDIYDFRQGIDKQVNPVSGAVVRGWITPREALASGWLFIGIGLVFGLYVFIHVGMAILWIGIVGIAIGVLYTWGPFPLKFNALGDLAVFLNFGILGALGAWAVQTGTLSWVPAVWAIPMSLLVVGILHSNNWRDIKSDSSGGIQTVASMLGDHRSEGYYMFLLIGPYVIISALIVISRFTGIMPKMPFTFLLTFFTLPMALKLILKGKQRHHPKQPHDFMALDGATAQLNLMFGILCILALGLDAILASILK